MNNTNIQTQTDIKKSWSIASARFEFRFAFVFANREQYLEFVHLWKAAYAQLSRALHEQKLLVKATQRQHEYAGKLQFRLLELQGEATVQLDMRRQAKLESHRQFLAARQTAD
jgi:hypothetical protein